MSGTKEDRTERVEEPGWSGVVLAGGRSSRMGRDKALVEIAGRTLLDRSLDVLRPHVDELLVIGDPMRHAQAVARVIPDDRPGMGPLAGIATALRHAAYERVIIMACDMPGVTAALVQRLRKGPKDPTDAFVPQCDGDLEPLIAVYHRRCLSVFEDSIAKGRLKVADALGRVNTTYVQICPGEEGWPKDLFRNVNAPTDL